MIRVLILLGVLCRAAAAAASCEASSGKHTTAFVELYTAEQCNGCSAAEQWLATLGRRFAVTRVVPVSLYVDASHYLASSDGKGRRRLFARSRALLPLQRIALVYSPQVLLQGGSFTQWNDPPAVEAALARINAQPARAQLVLEIRPAGEGRLTAIVHGRIVDAADIRDSALYLGAVQAAGGAYVALEWLGPIRAGPDGRIRESGALALLPAASPATSGAAAFVLNRHSGEVLQAVLVPPCSR